MKLWSFRFLSNVISGRNKQYVKVFNHLCRSFSKSCPNDHPAWSLVFIIEKGVGKIIYGEDVKPYLIVDLNQLDTNKLYKCFGIYAALLWYECKISQPDKIKEYESYGVQLFGDYFRDFVTLLSRFTPPKQYYEALNYIAQYSGLSTNDDSNPPWSFESGLEFQVFCKKFLPYHLNTLFNLVNTKKVIISGLTSHSS